MPCKVIEPQEVVRQNESYLKVSQPRANKIRIQSSKIVNRRFKNNREETEIQTATDEEYRTGKRNDGERFEHQRIPNVTRYRKGDTRQGQSIHDKQGNVG